MTAKASALPSEAWAEAWLKSHKNVYLFVTEVMSILPHGAPNPNGEPQLENWQTEFLQEFHTSPRHSIRSGHGCGKTMMIASLAIWFALCHYDAKCVITGASQDQLRDNVWPELRKWAQRLPAPLRQQIQIDEERLYVKAQPEMSFVVRRTASKSNPEAMQGVHAKHVLYLVDEACFDDQTEVLTDKGWMFFADLDGSERVLTKSRDGGSAYFEWPSQYFKYPYEGELVSYNTRALSFSVTPNHKLWRGKRNCKTGEISWGFQEAGSDLNQRLVFDRTFKWEGDEPESFTVPTFKGRTTHPARSIAMADWMEFLGWFLSEGSIAKQFGRPYSVVISQRGEAARDRIFDCMKRLGFCPRVYKNDVQVHSVQLATFLYDGKRAPYKRVPRYIMDLSPRLIRIFLDAYLEGDGYLKGGREVYYTSSKGMADDLQELLLRTGVHASICQRELPDSDFGTHVAHPAHPGYVVATYVKEFATVRSNDVKRVHYSGFVYCVEVPETHLLYVRREGKCHWSGNSGIPDIVFEVAQGSLSTEGAMAVLFSNPTRTSGFFADTHKKLRNTWKCRRVSSEDVPRARGHIEDIINAYGKDSNRYRVRVEGEFPTKDDDTVIPLELIEPAVGRKVEAHAVWPVWSLDVSRFGDDRTVLMKRQGNVVLEPPTIWRNLSTTQIAGRILDEYRRTPNDMKPQEICIDVIGYGAGVVDNLEERGSPLHGKVTGVNVAETASISGKYHRLRDELWWKGREWFEAKNCALPEKGCEELISELATPTYDFTATGMIVVCSKSEMKKDLGFSPDIADSFLLSLAAGVYPREPDRHRRFNYRPRNSDPWSA